MRGTLLLISAFVFSLHRTGSGTKIRKFKLSLVVEQSGFRWISLDTPVRGSYYVFVLTTGFSTLSVIFHGYLTWTNDDGCQVTMSYLPVEYCFTYLKQCDQRMHINNRGLTGKVKEKQ